MTLHAQPLVRPIVYSKRRGTFQVCSACFDELYDDSLLFASIRLRRTGTPLYMVRFLNSMGKAMKVPYNITWIFIQYMYIVLVGCFWDASLH